MGPDALQGDVHDEQVQCGHEVGQAEGEQGDAGPSRDDAGSDADRDCAAGGRSF